MLRITNVIVLLLWGLAFGFLTNVILPANAYVLAQITFGLAGLFSLISLLVWISQKIWPGRDKWYASSSYEYELPPENPQRAISRDRREQWRSCDTQEKDAWFEVDMGKPRMIAEIEFLTDNYDIEKPAKWRMMFYGKGHRTLSHKDGGGFVYVEGNDMPNKIQSFRVQIKEIAEDMPQDSNYCKRYHTTKVSWTISLIRVKEYRFSIFGKRFCKHEL